MVNYIDNKKFEALIQQYSSGDKTAQDELFDLFSLLIDNIMSGFNFKVDREEGKQECLLLILRVLKNFNKDAGLAFNYFTTIILNNLRLLYTKNRKYNEKMEGYREFKSGIYNPSSAAIEPE